MLNEQEINRIKREVDSYRNIDILSYIDEVMPWMKPIQHTVRRFSELLERSEVTYALISDYAVNFYGIPYWSRDIQFAIKGIDFRQLTSILSESFFGKLVERSGCLTILDLQMNNFLTICSEPNPLRWDDKMVERISKTIMDVKILSPEDYIVHLIKRGGLREIDLAAKILYLKFKAIDKDYISWRARSYNVEKELYALIEKLS